MITETKQHFALAIFVYVVMGILSYFSGLFSYRLLSSIHNYDLVTLSGVVVIILKTILGIPLAFLSVVSALMVIGSIRKKDNQ